MVGELERCNQDKYRVTFAPCHKIYLDIGCPWKICPLLSLLVFGISEVNLSEWQKLVKNPDFKNK